VETPVRINSVGPLLSSGGSGLGGGCAGCGIASNDTRDAQIRMRGMQRRRDPRGLAGRLHSPGEI
jgi:hypothetical protein